MIDLTFVWSDAQPLIEALSRPLQTIIIGLDAIERPLLVQLYDTSDRVIQIQSKMYDIGPRREIGVLRISRSTTHCPKILEIAVPEEKAGLAKVEKLVIQDDGIRAESGLVLTTISLGQLLVVAGAQPYGLAVRVPWGESPKFEPEYALDEYQKLPLD